jgi:hypothetical protein
MIEFFTGQDEVELTDELIKKLVEEKKWGDEDSLKDLRTKGAKWNIKRDSIVINL